MKLLIFINKTGEIEVLNDYWASILLNISILSEYFNFKSILSEYFDFECIIESLKTY